MALTQFKLAKLETALSLASGRFRTWTARFRSGRSRPQQEDEALLCVFTGRDEVVGHKENLADSKVHIGLG